MHNRIHLLDISISFRPSFLYLSIVNDYKKLLVNVFGTAFFEKAV
jgi:hypothetical protein